MNEEQQLMIARRMLEQVKALQAGLMLLGVTSSEVLPELPFSPPPQVEHEQKDHHDDNG